MGFGINTGISRNTNHTVQRAEKISSLGDIDEVTTYGGMVEITEEGYEDAGSFTSGATNGQVGNSSTAVTMSDSLIESNTEYARSTTTTM